jgi:uncharacterized protein (DUF952 family)
MAVIIYKIVPTALWEAAQAEGLFRGAPVDLKDGYIHFSTAEQVQETARRHFAGQRDLLLVSVNASTLGEALRFEASRGGDLFPHLYAPLDPAAAIAITPIPLGADGIPRIPNPLPGALDA